MSAQEFLLRHLQLFNTHPYLSAPIIGSVVKLEEEAETNKDGEASIQLKKALMGPYAAIGDAFFWGSLRPFAAIAAVMLAALNFQWAPVLFIVFYNTIHMGVRWKGFMEGYRLGNLGYEYVKSLNLPATNPKIRWISLGILASFGAFWAHTQKPVMLTGLSNIGMGMVFLISVLLCHLAIRKRISPLIILYVMTFFICLLFNIL